MVSPGFQTMCLPSRQQNGEVNVTMTITITYATPVNNHAMIEQAAPIALLESRQFVHEICELLTIKAVDVREFPHFDEIIPMMRQTVMPLRHTYLAKTAVASVMGKQKG